MMPTDKNKNRQWVDFPRVNIHRVYVCVRVHNTYAMTHCVTRNPVLQYKKYEHAYNIAH